MRKIIIDTDPGIDDSMAIFYALSSPELEVIGLTTVFGNATTPKTTKNALRLLEIAKRPDIPVAAGADRPMTMKFHGGADFVHGADGQGNTDLPAPTSQPVDEHAVQFLIDEIMSAPKEITLVPIGPLTNIAMAYLMEPKIAENLKEVVLMGGNAIVGGNASPTAEANVLDDPEAADIVFGMNVPITMVGLDVTEKAYMSPEVLDRIGTFKNARAQHLSKILPFYRAFHQSRYGDTGIHVHDSTAITYLLKPELFKTVQHPIRVETTGISRGKTWAAFGRSNKEMAWEGRPKINICVDLNTQAAIELELTRLAQ
jgi:inosine-uridine nucleoside N-ribohydrolase